MENIKINKKVISPCKQKKQCRICGNPEMTTILDLGEMPPANSFVEKKDLENAEASFPLMLVFCPKCSLVQLAHVVDPNILFENYYYMTGASPVLVEHFIEMAEEIAEKYISSKNDLVVEFGSNDGILLSALQSKCRVLGVDPAENIVQLARERGVETVASYFSERVAGEILKKFGPAKVIIANNVFAHIDDIRDVMKGVNRLLSPDGQFIFECHWVGNLIGEGGFDQIYHEHLCYYSLHSLKVLLDSFGLVINGMKLVLIHGASMRVYAGKSGKSSGAVSEFLEREVKMGLTEADTYLDFSKKVESSKKKLTELLYGLKKSGKRIAGYGAAAKGNTLLNYFKIGPDMLDFITDTTPAKQGTYTPGAHIPVVSPEILKRDQPDHILLLSWNYADAILEKEKELREKGVKFIIPVPEVRVV